MARVWTWGNNAFGSWALTPPPNAVSHPVQVTDLAAVAEVAAGYYHKLAVKADGTLWAWGITDLASWV